MSSASTDPTKEIKYLTAAESQALDDRLMGEEGFTLEQLMELAGLSVAEAVHTHYFPTVSSPSRLSEGGTSSASSSSTAAAGGGESQAPAVLVVSGPGNNGGDGLVAARHLKLFGWQPTVVLPKASSKPFLQSLVKQLQAMRIPVLDRLPGDATFVDTHFPVVVDAIFGFSFRLGGLTGAFKEVVATLASCQRAKIMAVDIPTGWGVEQGPPSAELYPDQPFVTPDTLISLSAPKLCAKHFGGAAHYLGGRFIPPAMAQELALNLPPYPSASQIARL